MTLSALAASRPVPAHAGEIAAFLANLENHWALCEDFVEIDPVDTASGAGAQARVALKGPAGLRRTASTKLLGATPEKVWGRAQLDSGSTARITWRLRPGRGTTEVSVAVELRDARLFDRVLFQLARPWLAARLAQALDRLARIAAVAAEQVGQGALTGSARSRMYR